MIIKIAISIIYSCIILAVVSTQSDSVDTPPDCPDSNNTVNEAIAADTIFDIDGNVYTTVTVGTQVWLVENLRVTRCRIGHELAYVSNDTEWSVWPSGAYCWCNDDSSYREPYGALYSFAAVVDSCGLCPKGWHVPTESEWLDLIVFLGGDEVAGGKLKEVGTVHWNYPNVGATDESGFRGLPGGGRGRISGSGDIGEFATWWSSTPYDSTYVWHYGLYRNSAKMRFNPGHRASGFSVRCIKD